MTTVFSLLWDEGRERRDRRGSSSGKPKIAVGGQSSSLRTLPPKSASGRNPGYVSDRASRVNAIVKSRFVFRGGDSNRHIIAHVLYIAERNQQQWEHRRFFTKDRSDIPRDDVVKYMIDHQGREVAMHKMILSPGDNSVNLVQYARESMKELEQTLGYKIDWFAVQHTNTDHYHIHVVIPGKIPEQDRQNLNSDRLIELSLANWAAAKEGQDLKLFRYNLDTLREAGNDYLLRERSIDRELDLAIERELGLNDWTYDQMVEKELGLRIWRQEKAYERELGLSTPEQDRQMQADLGMNVDRAAMRELGFGRYYDLGRPFRNDETPNQLYQLGQERGPAQPNTEPFDPMSSHLLREAQDDRKMEERDPLETNLPQLMLGLQSQRERNPDERDHVQDGFANALYEHQNPREQSASVADFEIQLLYEQHQDKDRDDDDERFKGGTQ